MRKLLHILRRESAGSAPYWEDFLYESQDEAATVATALQSIGAENRVDSGSGAFRPVAWESSCLQRRCGACAMVINSHPAMACDTRLRDLAGERVTLEPLGKFPVVEDLIVDRTVMMENLKRLSVWLSEKADPGAEDMAFEASRCLQCGLCLEVCPNFAPGLGFGGMAAMNPIARLIANSPQQMRKSLAKNYMRGVYSGCGKSLACRDICPAEIDMEKLLARSNAAAVWGRWKAAAGSRDQGHID